MHKNNHPHSLLILLLLALLPGIIHAQVEPLPRNSDTSISISSTYLHEARNVWIHLPENYNASTGAYPVLYLLDGEGHFKYVSELVEYLSSYDRNRMPPMIVVAILNVDRTRDFTPVHSLLFGGKPDSTRMATTGGGANFLNFIQTELVPYIDTHFRTQPYRILGAHSLGGLFGIYAKATAPDLFQSMILMSPAVYGGNTKVLGDFNAMLKARKMPAGKLYITLGNENKQTVDTLKTILTKTPGLIDWHFTQYSQENHFSVTYKSMYDGLSYIYRNWFVDNYSATLLSLQSVRDHFNKLSKEFGYTILPSEDFVNNAGYKQLNTGSVTEAIAIFRENTTNYPLSWNAWDSLGEAYRKKGDKQHAIESYQRSLVLNPGNEEGRKALQQLQGN